MNHADRERLSQLLDIIDKLTRLGRAFPGDEPAYADEADIALAEARAIVDAPNEPTDPALTEEPLPDEWINGGTFATNTEPPNPSLDAFLTEPIHEYTDRVPTRHRHRALSPLRLAVALTLVAIGLIAAVALTTPTPSPSHQDGTGRPSDANLWTPDSNARLYTYPPRTP